MTTTAPFVADLSAHPHAVRALADAFEAEWPEWCASVGRTALEEIFRSGADGTLPIVLAAFADGNPVGTVALRPWFGDEPMAEGPWVRQFLVLPAYRGRGIDRILGRAVEQRAVALGCGHLYAATNRIEGLLVRRGWQVFRRMEHQGAPMAWLRKAIGR